MRGAVPGGSPPCPALSYCVAQAELALSGSLGLNLPLPAGPHFCCPEVPARPGTVAPLGPRSAGIGGGSLRVPAALVLELEWERGSQLLAVAGTGDECCTCLDPLCPHIPVGKE